MTRHVDHPAEVGRRLREARTRAGLSQRELAEGACTAAYISRLELGERTPSLQLLRVLGLRLGVSADYLATGGGEAAVGDVVESVLVDAEIALRLGDDATARRLYEGALTEGVQGRARVEALSGLGQLALREGNHQEAIELLTDAVEASGLDVVELPAVADSLARAHAVLSEFSAAIAILQRCVDHYEKSEDVLGYIKFAAMLGYALTDNGDFAGAERVVAQALVRGHAVVDPYARARLYWSQSRLLAEQGQTAQAERYARKTLETLRMTEDTYAIAHALETLALIYVQLGRSREALELLDEGQPMIEAAGSPAEISLYQLVRARALAALGKRDEAASMAMQIAGALAEVHPVSRARAYLVLGDLYVELGDRARGEELYELAIEIAEGQPVSKCLLSAYRALADLLKARGETDAALALLERALSAQEQAPQLQASRRHDI